MSDMELKRDGAGRIYSHVRRKWLVETPEEIVRQSYLVVLVNEYRFSLDQIAEEAQVVGRGAARARADFVLWRTVEDKRGEKAPFIIVECKSDNVTIRSGDYAQGENYARLVGAPFFVTHNSRETRYWRVKRDRVPGYTEEIENIPHGDASDKEIQELLDKLRIFKEREFADLLHQCHNIIRNREKKDPAAAFDEIAKVLFIKVYVERQLLTRRSRENLFTVDVLNRQIADNPLDTLFQQTKVAYAADKIFGDEERINLRPGTGEEIVRKLERYNLSDTSEDVKGVAFERFLGRTFRGEIGQFFTPRSIVEFMVRLLEPAEGELVCDPASGSGGFLIRVFELVREQILADVDREYAAAKAQLDGDESLSDAERAARLTEQYEALQAQLDPRIVDSRLWKLSNRCIFGTDANDRMARTSKMNMIMHGDGHGGVHHHDGFLNVNGVFDGRFDIILTNPPFGSVVEPTDRVQPSDLIVSPEAERRYLAEYGDLYRQSQDRIRAALHKPIASLFELPRSGTARIKTELLFIERCLDLLKPGGRIGVVLPESVFNNPSLDYVRAFVENRARLLAVVSLPAETFISSGASVKCSLLFLQKLSEADAATFAAVHRDAQKATVKRFAKESAAIAALAPAKQRRPTAELNARIAEEARQLAKQQLDYPYFMYDADAVGISATGEETRNELIPGERSPVPAGETALERYRAFRAAVTKNRSLEAFRPTFSLDASARSSKAFVTTFATARQWDVKAGRAAAFIAANPDFVRLGDYIAECTETVKPWEDPEKLWPVYGVNNSDGVFLNSEQAGSEFNAPYKRIEKDWFFHNPTRANVGSIGIVPTVPADAITSPEYQVWRVTGGFLPEYMALLVRSRFFISLVDFNRVGGVKQRMYYANLAEIRLPLTPLAEQRRIIREHAKLQAELRKAQLRIDQERARLEERLLAVTNTGVC